MSTAAQELDLRIPSGRLHAQRWGAAGDPLLLCAHGLTANMHAFGRVGEALAGPGRQVVAVDLRGRGRSDHGAPGSYGVAAHAEDLLAAATALGAERFDLVGWSLGALAGIAAASIAPARLRSLALLDHAGRMDPAAVEAVRTALGRLGQPVADPDDYVAGIRDAGVVSPWSDVWARHYRYELEPDRDGDGDGDEWRATTSRAACEEDLASILGQSFAPLWRAIAMPALLVRATIPFGGGLVVPEDERDALRAAVPHLRLVEVDRNHFGAVTDDRTVAALQELLDEARRRDA